VFYGQIINQKLNGFCCYAKNGTNYYCLYETGNLVKIVVAEANDSLLEVESVGE
jgi:hypothetical protein